jgi:CelD/BcsL family acetyltransferase involved in cellulose biosynthesis
MPSATAAPTAAPGPIPAAGGDALILLSLLQERGRFLDFVAEDISAYSDAQVAAASRVVHQGCKAVINECLALAPAHPGAEGDRITVDPAADPNRYRLQGKLAQQPPYSGVVVHRGWKTTRLALPRHTRPIDPAGENIVAPVDVEVR